MSNILLIIICLLVGFLLKSNKNFPKASYKVLNQFVIYISMPALAMYYIPKLEVSASLIYPLLVAWLNIGLAFVFFNFIGKKYNWSKKLIGCLIICAGLGNTSFVGFPIIQALFGDEGIKTAVIIDQPGTFVVLSTVAIIIATKYSREGTTNQESIFKKLIQFPPFVGFLIGLILNLFGTDFPTVFQDVFKTLGATVSPLALVAVGMQLEFDKQSKHFKFLALGLFFKLILFPLCILTLYVFIFGASGLAIDVCIIEAAMAPMITGTIVAANYGLKPKLSTMMIGFGIPISFITLTIWYYILQLI
nr:AEC family transporter [uncultured Flavobacterium sp.]